MYGRHRFSLIVRCSFSDGVAPFLHMPGCIKYVTGFRLETAVPMCVVYVTTTPIFYCSAVTCFVDSWWTDSKSARSRDVHGRVDLGARDRCMFSNAGLYRDVESLYVFSFHTFFTHAARETGFIFLP